MVSVGWQPPGDVHLLARPSWARPPPPLNGSFETFETFETLGIFEIFEYFEPFEAFETLENLEIFEHFAPKRVQVHLPGHTYGTLGLQQNIFMVPYGKPHEILCAI